MRSSGAADSVNPNEGTTMELRSRFFRQRDFPVEGPPREIVGYGEHPPRVRWE
jgi:hypothetical protein